MLIIFDLKTKLRKTFYLQIPLIINLKFKSPNKMFEIIIFLLILLAFALGTTHIMTFKYKGFIFILYTYIFYSSLQTGNMSKMLWLIYFNVLFLIRYRCLSVAGIGLKETNGGFIGSSHNRTTHIAYSSIYFLRKWKLARYLCNV